MLKTSLAKKAELLAANRPDLPAFLEKANYFAENLFWIARDDIILETDSTKEAMERNQKKVDEKFDSMTHKVNEQGEEVKNMVSNLIPQQQEDALAFWVEVDQFFMDIFDWLTDVFALVINRIRNGFTLVKGAINALFDTVMGWLQKIFE